MAGSHNPFDPQFPSPPRRWGCLERLGWCFLVGLLVLILVISSKRTPPGYHVVIKNFQGSTLQNVVLDLPWGKYQFKMLEPMQPTKPWEYHHVSFQPRWQFGADTTMTITATDRAGAVITKKSHEIYFSNPTEIEITFEPGGVTIVDRRSGW